ncbi:MAG: hypothetical protein ACHQF0_04995 [Chitinophagales bacterium]
MIQNFWSGSTISFQTKDKQWQKGEITKIQNDSFYIRPQVIKYSLFRTDTFYYNIMGFSVSDVYAMPKKGVLIDYKNGQFQIITSAGHQHWYWIKSGWVFRVSATGYAVLNIANGLIKNNFSISESKTQLGIAAAVFAGGVIMHKAYKLTLRTGKKYHLRIFQFGLQ